MAKHTRRADVEYKETVVFELFPALEYDKAQKQRLIPFRAYRNNIRRIINYAAHFDAPNRICMVYIVGEVAPEKIQKLLAAAECSDRVCVLTSPFPEDELTFWRAFDERRDALQKQGNWDEERQTVTAEWLHMRDNEIWWKGILDAAEPDLDGQICIDAPTLAVPDVWRTYSAKLVAQQAETLDMIRHYHALVRKAPSCFRRWTFHRRGREPTQFRHADTGKLIAKTYPYGTEARGVNAYAGLSPASIEPAVKLITDGAENRRLGFDRAFAMDFKPVRKIRKFVEDALAAQGYCTLSALADFIKSPPFGLDNNGYSAAILSAALYDVPGLLFFDRLTDSPLQQEGMLYLCREILPPEDSRPAFNYRRAGMECCLYREYPCHKVVRDALAGLYGLEDCEGRYAVVYARAKIETLFRLPLSMSDDLLFRLTGPEIRWHDRAEMERLAAEVTARRDELPRILAAHIAKDNRIPCEERIPGAACWLWERDELYRGAYCMASTSEFKTLQTEERRISALYDKAQCLLIRITTFSLHGETDKMEPLITERESLLAEADAANERNRADWQSLRDVCRGRLEALCGKSL